MRVFGTSMLPALYPGSEVLISRARQQDLQPGDVVLAKNKRGLCLHRLVENSGGTFITRGDNCAGNDPPVPLDELLGVLTRVERRPGLLARMRIRLLSFCR